MDQQPYIGRFAPSPTGPLHFGSLVAALASYLEARSRNGRWLVRMEDLDRPREVAGAADDILRTLEAFGLHWDGPVMLQSERDDAYAGAMERLHDQGLIFPCACTRKQVIAAGRRAEDGSVIYPGTCRDGIAQGLEARTQRVRVPSRPYGFEDRIQGPYRQQLDIEVGDFILRRADALFAYQLAVVVDDAEQGVTDVVRGIDLMPSTPRQLFLQDRLELPTPGYAHLPIAIGEQGQKLSKQTFATALSTGDTGEPLYAGLVFLGQQPPAELRNSAPELLRWARQHWRESAIPRVTDILAPAEYR